MQTVPQIVPITEMAQKQSEVLSRLAHGPIVLAQHSRAAAVLVSVAEWDKLINQLTHYEHLLMLEEESKRVARGEYLTQEQVEAGLRERGLL